MKQVNNQSKSQFETTILTNIKASYKDYLKLTNRKDFLKLLNELDARTEFDDNGAINKLFINGNLITNLKKFIFANNKLTNNELKQVINNAYKHSCNYGLQVMDKSKDETTYRQCENIKGFAFFKSLNLQVYFYNKKVVKNRLTGNFETK